MTIDVSLTANRFYGLGVAVIPCKLGDKRPAIPAWGMYQKELPTPLELLGWFANTERMNIGVVTGWRGLTVLDFDRQSVYESWLRWAREQRDSLVARIARRTYRVSTSRGVHVYITLATTERNRHLDGIDVKATGGYVLGEGSVHPSGAIYTAMTSTTAIMRADVLSDVLPTALLTAQPLPSGVAAPSPRVAAPASNDPWAVAAAAPVVSTGIIDRIRKAVRLESFFPAAQNTSADGRWRITQCPLHDDHTPSLWLDTERQICGCYAGCTTVPLDVINLYARLYGLSNREAIFSLAKAV